MADEQEAGLTPIDSRQGRDKRAAAALSIGNSDPEYDKYVSRLSKRKVERIHRTAGNLKHGLHTAAPLTCTGPRKCPFINHCPIPERDEDGSLSFGPLTDYPMYRPCILEKLKMEQAIVDYMEVLKIDPDDPIEVALVSDLAVIDLYKMRASMVLSSGDRDGEGRDLLRIDNTGYSEHGQAATSSQLHPAFQAIESLEKRRLKVLTSLQATREKKFEKAVKLGTKSEDSRILVELRAVKAALTAAAKRSADTPVPLLEEPMYLDR